MQVPQRKGDPLLVDTDEGVRPGTTAESLGALKPAFTKDGTITAGNASQISDGGCRRRRDVGRQGQGARRHAARVSSSATAWWPAPTTRCSRSPRGPSCKAARKAGVDLGSIDLFEINEAFAAVGLASMDDLGIDEDKVNVNGGRHRARPPGRHVGHPGRAHRAARAAPARCLDRGRGAVRRRRPGRRRHPAPGGSALGRDGIAPRPASVGRRHQRDQLGRAGCHVRPVSTLKR